MFEVRPSSNADEYARSIYGIAQYFGSPLDEERIERFGQVLPFERMHAAFEGDEIVGGAGAFPFELSVPGGVLPCGGVTVVGVYPDASPPGRLARDDGCAAARHPRARGADRGALGE